MIGAGVPGALLRYRVMAFVTGTVLVFNCASLPVHGPPATRYDISACCGSASNGAGFTRSSIAASSAWGVPASGSNAIARCSFWLAAIVAAKFVRASRG